MEGGGLSAGLAATVRIDRATGYEALANEARDGRALMTALGKRGEKVLRAHFLEKDNTPNKKGWRRSHFWNRRIRANTVFVASATTARTAVIDVAAPELAQKVYGGRITPKHAKNLALPGRSEAAGRSPRYFDNLHFVPLHRGDLTGLLVMDGAPKGDAPYYFLFKSVEQDPDPTALPSDERWDREIKEEAEDFFNRRANA